MRGFNDKFNDLDIYAGTIGRSGQGVVKAVAAENPDFILFSFDVSQAFANGMPFEEFSALIGTRLGKYILMYPKEI